MASTNPPPLSFLKNNINALITHIYNEFPERRNEIIETSYSSLNDIQKAEPPNEEDYRLEKIKLYTNSDYMFALFTSSFIKVYYINSIFKTPAFYATDLKYL